MELYLHSTVIKLTAGAISPFHQFRVALLCSLVPRVSSSKFCVLQLQYVLSKQLNSHCVIFYVPHFITRSCIQMFSLALYIGVLLLKNEGKMSKLRCRV